MRGEVFYWIFNMSISGAICGAAILILRCIKAIPRRVIRILWLIPLIRMCVPFGVTAKYGLMSLLTKFTAISVPVHEIRPDLTFAYMNHIGAAEEYFPLTYKISRLDEVFSTASVVWLTVALASVLAFILIYACTLRELKDATPLGDGVYRSDKIKVPAVYGMIRPRIILPHAYAEDELHFILLHERAHIRRGDNLFRMAALIVVCFHWFNPLAWLFLKLLYADIELACDESVLSHCNAEDKKNYARSLLCSAEKANVFAASFGGAKIRLRIENILSYKKISAFSAVGFAAFVLSVAYVLLTNAV